MNRQQRRQAHIANIPVDQLVMPHQMTPDQSRQIILWRIQQNLADTKHPFHHKTADGTIVDTDPTLEYLVSRLTDVPRAVPVNRKFYGMDPYEQHH